MFSFAVPMFPMTVLTWPSMGPSVPVGTSLYWNSRVDGATDRLWYRYRVRGPSEAEFRVVRDYSPVAYFLWTPVETDGIYQVEATAHDLDTGEEGSTVAQLKVDSRAQNNAPVITPTGNELVFLYSVPPCPEGARSRVEMISPKGKRQFTDWRSCMEGQSLNWYLAGMRASTLYRIREQTDLQDGTTILSPPMDLTTGGLRWQPVPSKRVEGTATWRDGLLLQSKTFEYMTAIDLDGNTVWYATVPARYLTRPVNGGYFLILNDNPQAGDEEQTLRLIDLAGNTVFETNAGAINLQLARMGYHPITSFHHEARMLSDGRILALAGTERILTDVQGPGDVDVLGDMILVLNRDLQVEWAWDAFDHLDTSRKAVLDETCTLGTGGCPVFRKAETANDWLHGNALQLTADGNILYSARHQDQVFKINYAKGQGSGEVLWRMGKDGDFQIVSDDPWPWFSHQHDPNFAEGSPDVLMVFDNGNTRAEEDDHAESRGQVFRVDEAQRSVTPIVNIKLGAYSLALGSAQLLEDGNYHFDLGWMPNMFSQAVEVDTDGNVVSRVETEGPQYRSFRMRNLYTEQRIAQDGGTQPVPVSGR